MANLNTTNLMQAIQWQDKCLALKQVAQPEPLINEALIKISMAGICNTDLEIIAGYYPFEGTLGHEFVGIIESANDPQLIGRRVVSDINCSCYSCKMCRAGHPHHCLNRQTIGINKKPGAFARYLCAPISNLVMVPDSVSDKQAVFAEPVAAALEIIEQVDFCHIEEVAVIGDGKLGLLITMCLASHGLKVVLIGHHKEKQALVAELGVELLSTIPDRKFAVVVEATGNPSGFDDAILITQARGTLVLKSTYAGNINFNPGPLVVNEITLLGSRCGPMQKAIDLMEDKRIFPEKLIDSTYSLDDGLKAFSKAQVKGVLKVIIES